VKFLVYDMNPAVPHLQVGEVGKKLRGTKGVPQDNPRLTKKPHLLDEVFDITPVLDAVFFRFAVATNTHGIVSSLFEYEYQYHLRIFGTLIPIF